MWFCLYSPTSSMQQIHRSTSSAAHVSVRFFFFFFYHFQIVTQYTMTLDSGWAGKHMQVSTLLMVWLFSQKDLLLRGCLFRSSLHSFVMPCFEWVPPLNIFFLLVFLLVNAYFTGEVVEGENQKFDEADMFLVIHNSCPYAWPLAVASKEGMMLVQSSLPSRLPRWHQW